MGHDTKNVARVFAQREALGGWSDVGVDATFGPEHSQLMLNESWRAFITGPDTLRQRSVAQPAGRHPCHPVVALALGARPARAAN